MLTKTQHHWLVLVKSEYILLRTYFLLFSLISCSCSTWKLRAPGSGACEDGGRRVSTGFEMNCSKECSAEGGCYRCYTVSSVSPRSTVFHVGQLASVQDWMLCSVQLGVKSGKHPSAFTPQCSAGVPGRRDILLHDGHSELVVHFNNLTYRTICTGNVWTGSKQGATFHHTSMMAGGTLRRKALLSVFLMKSGLCDSGESGWDSGGERLLFFLINLQITGRHILTFCEYKYLFV